jgi:drug/metabolite transporter (DMT)-like permease
VLILSAELVIAAVSSWLIANETMSLRAWVGGTMIIAAGLISSRWGD